MFMSLLKTLIFAIYRRWKLEFNLSLQLNILYPVSDTLVRTHVYLAKRNALFPKIFHLFRSEHDVINVEEIEESGTV